MRARSRPMAWALLACAVALAPLAQASSAAPVPIVVVLTREATPYRQALRGFEEVLQGSGRGYKFHEFSMEKERDERALVSRIREHRPGLILTIGSGAMQVISESIRDIPVVFSLVLPSSGDETLESLMEARGNLTGASMEIPLRTQFEKVREILPQVKQIGVLYDPAVTGPKIETASQAATSAGLELIRIPVTSERDLMPSLEKLAGQVDLLWSVPDSTVFSPQGLRQVLLATLRDRIPFVGLSHSFVKAGALLALSVDYRDVGRQAGEQALRVLAGEPASRIPMSIPRRLSLSLNMNTAKQIQVEIQDSVRQKAELFF